jgi:uncharacterized FAD-dependent dehydrogenase
MMKTYDIAILGVGIAGMFALYRLTEKYGDASIIAIDAGRPPAKRRSQMLGFAGLLAQGDGKYYLTDTKQVENISGARKAKAAAKWVAEVFKNVSPFETTKDRMPSTAVQKRLRDQGFSIQSNNFVQLYPAEIHALSKFVADDLDSNKNITFSFDNEIFSLTKTKHYFSIQTQNGEFRAKKVILAVGRAGWRWAQQVFNHFGLVEDNQFARFGVRLEMTAALLKDFNKSNCTLHKENVMVGPFSWNGTVIPEDHVDMAISAFRSNETRWKTDKVSFAYIRETPTENLGFEQTDRIGKLTFLMTNDRVNKERVSSIFKENSSISLLKDYDWLKQDMKDLAEIIPDVLTKAYFHIPTLLPLPSKINIGKDLSTEVNGLYVAGETAGIIGIAAAAQMGYIVAEAVAK